MGIIFKGLTFGGVNSLDYGIFITGEAVYNAPERSVTSIEIDGRNGDLLIDNGRFLNIDVSYPAGCFAETQEDFKQKIESFRNAIISQISYQRLTDDYNPDEYRLAVYKSGLEVNVAVLHQGGEFNLTFDCKPQRFLTSGETERSIPEWSDMHTDSGSLVTIDNSSGEYAVKSLSAGIVPQQDLNGYDNPWAGGAGKNLLHNVGTTTSSNNVTATFNANGSVTLTGTASAQTDFFIVPNTSSGVTLPANTNLIVSGGVSADIFVRINIDGQTPTSRGGDVSVTSTSGIVGSSYIRISQGTATNITIYPMVRLATVSDATWEPYENICPITGFSSANIYVSPTTSVGDATTYNVSFGSAGTVYGGTLDVVSGQLTVTKIFRQAVASELDSSHWGKGGSTNFDEFYMVSTADTYGKTGENYGVENIRCSHAPSLSSASTTQMFTRLANREARIVFPLSMGINSLNAFYAWNQTQINNNKPLQFCYVLQTPVTYQLTATQVALLLGTNNIWSNTGDIQIEYGKGGNTLYNPTLFDSRPLLVVTGYGNLGINSQTLTIENGYPSQVVYIDCDSMEAWTESGGVKSPANDLIQNAGDAFPTLKSGMNAFGIPATITALKVTPRWWRI